MNRPCKTLQVAALAGLALAASIGASHAQTFLTGSYTNNFDTCGQVTPFSGECSVAGWVYWYGTPGGDTPMTNDVYEDVNNNPNSGSLLVVSPFDSSFNQNFFFGTFDNTPFGTTEEANLLNYSDITFYIKMAPGTPPRTNSSGVNLDFGTIGVGIFFPYAYEELERPTIPLAASNNWVMLTVPINHTLPNLTNVSGVAFDIDSADGYPQFSMTNYIDSLQMHALGTEVIPVALAPPVKATPGLNCIASAAGTGGEFNRYQVSTVADTGYSFVGRPSVTYSWNIESFPAKTGGNFQQHFFIVNGAPGPFDDAPDYNLADCLFMTVQQSDAGTATFDFRYKTNEPGGNGMLFNTFSPGDSNDNPYGWPVEPVASLSTTAGALGTWSVTFANNTNITVHAPDGSSTNFSIDPATAALFADPATLILGGQPNNPNGAGKAVVYSSFSASGCAAPISDNFLADTTLNTAVWQNLSNDTNGLYLVPATAAYWLSWTLPDAGYQLQSKAGLGTPGGWTQLSTPEIVVNGRRQALLDNSQLPSGTQGYFQLFQFQSSQLQVLLAGESNAPYTPTGKTGTPTPSSLSTNGGYVTATINAVDSNFNTNNGVPDTIHVTSSADPDDVLPADAALVNGTLTEQVRFNATGSYTITATDITTTNVPPATSSSVTITP
jgi:hypothetical protein